MNRRVFSMRLYVPCCDDRALAWLDSTVAGRFSVRLHPLWRKSTF